MAGVGQAYCPANDVYIITRGPRLPKEAMLSEQSWLCILSLMKMTYILFQLIN